MLKVQPLVRCCASRLQQHAISYFNAEDYKWDYKSDNHEATNSGV